MTEELTKAAPNNHGPIYETDLYDFAGWLTTRPGVMAVGSSCEAGPMAEAVGEYIKTFPERFALTQRPAAQEGEREAWAPYLVDRADGVKGHYAIGRWNPRGYQEVWNLHSHRWAAYSDDVMSLEEADSLLRQITIPTARASLPAPQQATPDLADGPARMHWTNWMPVKDALEYAYQKMGLEMVKTDAGAKYPNLHWNLAGLVREFVVAQQDAMFGKCQACGKSMGLLDQIKCLDCGTRLCEPCAKEHFGSDHGARAAASHSHPAPTTSGWVETSAPPQRLDWSDTQQATPERHLTVTTNQQGEAVMVSWQDDEHRILDVVWERKPATPEPVGEPVARVELMQTGGNAGLATRIVEIDDPLRERLRPGDLLFTRPAPGVPEGWRNVIAGTLKTDPWDSARVADYNSGWNDCQRKTLRGLERLAAAQAKGGQA